MLDTQPWIPVVELNVSFPRLGRRTSRRCSASLSLIRPLPCQCHLLALGSSLSSLNPSPSKSQSTPAGVAAALAPGTARIASLIDCVDHPSLHARARFPIHPRLQGRGGYRRCATQSLARHLTRLGKPLWRMTVRRPRGTALCPRSCAHRALVASPQRARGRRCPIARV